MTVGNKGVSTAVRDGLGGGSWKRGGSEKGAVLEEGIEGLKDNRLVKIVAEQLKDTGYVEWWEEYGVLIAEKRMEPSKTKQDQDQDQDQARPRPRPSKCNYRREKMEEGNDQDCTWEEVESKSSLGCMV